MLPFPRISQYGNVVIDNVVLDVDFSTYPIGPTTTITDAKGHTFTKNGSGSSSIVNDATKGNVLQFSSAYYTTPMVQNLQLSNTDFEIRIVFKSTSTSENIPFCTGDYYTPVPPIVGGLLFTCFNSTGSQLFATTTGGTFTRCIYGYTVNTWRDISMKWDSTTKVMELYDNDTNTVLTTQTISAGFGDGNFVSIGGSYVRGTVNSFVGQIKSVKITRLL